MYTLRCKGRTPVSDDMLVLSGTLVDEIVPTPHTAVFGGCQTNYFCCEDILQQGEGRIDPQRDPVCHLPISTARRPAETEYTGWLPATRAPFRTMESTSLQSL